MDRSNQAWLDDLAKRAEPALLDLRGLLVRNLRRGLAGRVRADDAFIEDCAQESLLRVLDKLDRFSGRSGFVTWATSIAIRVALSQLRRRQWGDVTLGDLVPETGAGDAGPRANDPPPDAQLQRSDLLRALESAIHRDLTDRQRTALLAELRGMPQDEIAQQLGSSRNALYKLTHDARKKLKDRLEAAGFTAEDLTTSTAR